MRIHLLRILFPAWVAYLVAFDLVVQDTVGDTQNPGSFFLDPVGPFQRLDYELLLRFLEIYAFGR